MNSILMSSLSPTQQRGEYIPDAGCILYEKITNKDGDQFNAVITYWMIGPETFDYNYMVIGDHGIPDNYLREIVEEIIQKAI